MVRKKSLMTALNRLANRLDLSGLDTEADQVDGMLRAVHASLGKANPEIIEKAISFLKTAKPVSVTAHTEKRDWQPPHPGEEGRGYWTYKVSLTFRLPDEMFGKYKEPDLWDTVFSMEKSHKDLLKQITENYVGDKSGMGFDAQTIEIEEPENDESLEFCVSFTVNDSEMAPIEKK